MGPAWRFLTGIAPIVAILSIGMPACAADITAEQTALIYDLLDPLTKEQDTPRGIDPKIFSNAISILKQEGLAGQNIRPHFQEQGLLARYGKALFLGARAPEFVAEIGHIHDLVARRDKGALEEALKELWVKAGRTEPDEKALEPVITSLYGTKGEEPEETIRHVIDKPEHRIDIAHAPAGGLMQVDVITRNPDGSPKDRTAFQGLTETQATPDGRDLERRIRLEKTCTSTPNTDKKAVKGLEGEWIEEGNGNKWAVSRQGDQIAFEEIVIDEKPRPRRRYTGRFSLGRVEASYPITRVEDMGDNLPTAVRQQLTGMGIDYKIALEFCGGDTKELSGTWSSQHVTYDAMFLQVDRIHDPFDLVLNLKREEKPKEEKIAQGAATDELP